MKKKVVAGLSACVLCSSIIVNIAGMRKSFSPIFIGEAIHKSNSKIIKYDDDYTKFLKLSNQKAKEKLAKEMKIQKEKQLKLIVANQPKKKTVSLSRGGEIEIIEFILTFYTDLNCENSEEYGGVTCKGIKLFDGVAANNIIAYGTKIKLQGWGYVEVLDTGGSNFNSPHRLDVYVPRLDGESDRQYYRRVQKMGVQKVKGYIINN